MGKGPWWPTLPPETATGISRAAYLF